MCNRNALNENFLLQYMMCSLPKGHFFDDLVLYLLFLHNHERAWHFTENNTPATKRLQYPCPFSNP